MTDITEIDDALESALSAILACQAIRKAAASRPLDFIRQSDVLRKVDSLAASPRASDANERALEMLADAERRIERIEASRAKELEQAEARKTYTVHEAA